MGVTVIAEFDTVDFAERAARRVKSHFPQAGKAVIKCRPANHAGQHGIDRFIVPVQSAYNYFEAAAYTPNAMFSTEPLMVSHPETEERHTASLEIATVKPEANKIAGYLISCGGYHIRRV